MSDIEMIKALIDDNERLKAAVYAVHGAGVAELHEQISQLKSESEKLKADLREAKDAKLGLSWAIGEIMGERDKLNGENDELRKDSERLDWMNKNCHSYVTESHTMQDPEGEVVAYRWSIEQPEADIRSAIDYAMSHEE